MALYKEITDNKGVITRYFRISNITFDIDNDSLNVTVKEYTNEDYRDIEKNIRALKEEINEKQSVINTLNENYRENEEEILEKNKELYSLITELNSLNESSYYVGETVYSFDFTDQDYSITDCYNLLKTLDVFANSTNV